MSANVSSSTNSYQGDTLCALGAIQPQEQQQQPQLHIQKGDGVDGGAIVISGEDSAVVSSTTSPLPHAKGVEVQDVVFAAENPPSSSSISEPMATVMPAETEEVVTTAAPHIDAVPTLNEVQTVLTSLAPANCESVNQQALLPTPTTTPTTATATTTTTSSGTPAPSTIMHVDQQGSQQHHGGVVPPQQISQTPFPNAVLHSIAVDDRNQSHSPPSKNAALLCGDQYNPVTPPTTIMLGSNNTNGHPQQLVLSSPLSGGTATPNGLFMPLVSHSSTTTTNTNSSSSNTLTAGLPLAAYPATVAPASPISSVGNVYVANLRTSTDASRIRAYFQNFGQVLHVKLLLDIATGISRCIAFVMFANFSDALQACSLATKTELDGAIIQVRMAQRGTTVNPDTHVYSPLVFLRNVPSTTLRSEVSAYCETHFGSLKNITLHPQSHELGGPSPYNMMVLEFHHAEQASLFVEGTDGRARFTVPENHPLLMAKMITNPAAEMRKSILLRPSPGTAPQHGQQGNNHNHGNNSASRKMPGSGGGGAPPSSMGSVMGYAPPPPPPFQQQHHQQHHGGGGGSGILSQHQQQGNNNNAGAISQLFSSSPASTLGHPPPTTHNHGGYPSPQMGGGGGSYPHQSAPVIPAQHQQQPQPTSMMQHHPQGGGISNNQPPPQTMSDMFQMRLPNGDLVLVSRGQHQQQSNMIHQQQQQHPQQFFQPQHQHQSYTAVSPTPQHQHQHHPSSGMYAAPSTAPTAAPLFQQQGIQANPSGGSGAQMMYIQLRDGSYAAVPAYHNAPTPTSVASTPPPVGPHFGRHQQHPGAPPPPPPPPPPSYNTIPGMRHPTSTTTAAACIPPTYHQLQQQNQLQQRSNIGVSPQHYSPSS